MFASRRRPLRRRAGRRSCCRSSRDLPSGARGDRGRATNCSTRCSIPRRRSTAATHRSIRMATSSAISGSCAATPTHRARSSSRGPTRSGMQDQAFLGLEAALAVPDPGGRGVELHVATQWLHEDRGRSPPVWTFRRRVGAAWCSVASAARSVPARTSACRSTRACSPCGIGRPVRMAYSRAESFLGHVHRHPATIWMRHHATTDGEIVQSRPAW